jgi:serine/threonine protein kinase
MKQPSEAPTLDFDKPDAMVGQLLDGRFLIEKNLADGGADEGGIGLVYLAVDTKLMGKKVVVKILREAALKHDDIVRKFLHEKEALIRLDHPGIVRILDSGTLSDNNPFMVMEFIEGYSLRKELKKYKQLPLEVAAHIISSVTDALAAAHSKNIVHRDIKPENIMLTPQDDGWPRVRLIDFGIARVGESQLAPGTEISRAIGTILYIPPEQLIGSLHLTPALDIYAVGIVAYEMLTGELPFKPKAIAEMYQMEKEGVKIPPTELRPDLPRVAERILLSALEFAPENRPQNARTFGRYLASELLQDSLETDRFYASVQTEYADVPSVLTMQKTLEQDDTATVDRIDPPEGTGNNWGFLKWVLPVLLVIGLVTGTGAYMILNRAASIVGEKPLANSAAVTAAPKRELYYHLNVQKMRDGKPFEQPFKSSGQEALESGYKFSMAFEPQADGFLWVFNEGVDAQGKRGYFLLFPTPRSNQGSSQVTSGQLIETSQNTLSGKKGTEIMWMIWTKERNDDLDAVTREAFERQGVVSDSNAPALQNVLNKYEQAKPESSKDTANQRTVVRADGDIIVHRFEIEHR